VCPYHREAGVAYLGWPIGCLAECWPVYITAFRIVWQGTVSWCGSHADSLLCVLGGVQHGSAAEPPRGVGSMRGGDVHTLHGSVHL
jgi:hypothetical protein